jgi:hypothetical protein
MLLRLLGRVEVDTGMNLATVVLISNNDALAILIRDVVTVCYIPLYTEP